MCGPSWSCHLHFLLGPALFPWLYGLSQPLMAFCVQGEKRGKRVVTVAGFSFQSQRGVVISLPFLMFLYYCRYD